MYVLDDRISGFYDHMMINLKGRGLETTVLAQFDESKFKKPVATFLTCGKNALNSVQDKNFLDFVKNKKFRKVFVLDLESESYCVNTFFNSAITVFSIPSDLTSKNFKDIFFLHSFIDLAVKDIPNLPCGSEQSIRLVNLIRKVSPTNATVLISGPTGTGKELLSSLIHSFSHRKENAFIALNCAAVPDQMLESILFGHEKGSFTGAIQSNVGLIRAADGGTILLDEISEMPLNLQSKLLRVIQEKKVLPIGTSKEVDVDVRILATTNRDMLEEVKKGTFREDLFYRLNVFPLNNQCLNSRKDDIVPIVANMLIRSFFENGELISITDGALESLIDYSWPGNVRELDNLIQRAKILSVSREITEADLIFDVSGNSEQPNTAEILASKVKSNLESEVL